MNLRYWIDSWFCAGFYGAALTALIAAVQHVINAVRRRI